MMAGRRLVRLRTVGVNVGARKELPQPWPLVGDAGAQLWLHGHADVAEEPHAADETLLVEDAASVVVELAEDAHLPKKEGGRDDEDVGGSTS